MLKHMLWNPERNKSLYIMRCAEQFISNPTEHSAREILNRISAELKQHAGTVEATPYLQFRLVFLSRQGTEIQKHILFMSPAHRHSDGGSDRMTLLVLCCLSLVKWLPELQWQEIEFGDLALQLVLSYFISGWVKVINAEWRSGLALQGVFRFSAYPSIIWLQHRIFVPG